MDTIYIQYFKTKLGEMILGDFQGQLCLADWRFRKRRSQIDKRILDGLNSRYKSGSTDIITETQNQIEEYFHEDRKSFSIPLLLTGSEFQKKVWNELLKIPFGITLSYLELSEKLGDKQAIRAVASANGANAISIIVPCHRILGSKGELTGYAGGLDVKRELLKLEKVNPNPLQYSLFD